MKPGVEGNFGEEVQTERGWQDQEPQSPPQSNTADLNGFDPMSINNPKV